MKQCRIAVLHAGLLAVSLFANAAVKSATIQIKVLDSETRSISTGDSGVPKNCDVVNYDAYCLSSKTAEVINTLLVQEGNEPPYRVSCAIDSKWSRCVPLLKGESFQARKEKRGITVYYVDDVGKMRKQLYTYVAEKEGGNLTQPAAARGTEPRATSTAKVGQASTGTAAADSPQAKVKCSFSSMPAGAEITVDGRYVGSTPSAVSLSVGTHAVEVSLPRFAPWKRDLTVSSGSELTVNAVLEKGQ